MKAVMLYLAASNIGSLITSDSEAEGILTAWRDGVEVSFNDTNQSVYVNMKAVVAVTITEHTPKESTEQNLWPERENV